MGDIVTREPCERERARDGLSTEGDERQRERARAGELCVAVPGEDEDPGLGEFAGEELQQDQGRGVGRVQIVEHEHERLPDSDPPEERRGRVEQAEASGIGIPRARWRRHACQPFAHLGHELGDVRGAASEL